MAADIAIKIDNRYEVLGELGRGGMGVVYKANDLKMDRLVAIKVMTTHAPGRDEYQERFLREAKSIAKLQHPNIVVVHDHGYHGGAPYMAMEYVEGVPLDKVIASRVSLTALAKVDYIVQVCHALHYAHQQGIVHRDVKPGNIMVLDGGKRVKLLDFGIARAGGASNLSKSGLALGTTCYMSPEQTRGQKDLDGRADIFSAGVVLYELLAGKPPWTGDGDYEIMTKIIHDPVPPLAASRNYPAALDHILECALAKDANARYQTAEKMAQELAELETSLKEQALEEALNQFENGDLLRANDLVSQILRIDTRHREAIELRAKLQQVVQLQQQSEQVRHLRTTAEEAVGQKRYSDALAAVEQAITIDAANTELFHYRELIRHEVKRREDIRKKLELAKRAQEINDLSTAQELVDKALEADPTDTQARIMKSSLEQERKRQQQQEIVEEASRALAVRAFARAKEFIQQLEALDPDSPPLSSLKNKLQQGEAEEKRRVEIENLIRDIRRVLESGDVSRSLSATEQALARFPGEARLARLHAQAEALREAAERERAIQGQIALIQKLTEKGQNAKALVAAESALKQLGVDYRLQSFVAQLRQTVERERRLQAEQSILAQARNAMQAEDFRSAVEILSAGRVDFPNSQEISEALQAAQTANAKQDDAAEREHKLQAERAVLTQAGKAMQAGNLESALRILTAAHSNFPNSQEIADALQSAQAANAQKADAVERERKVQAEQAALMQARKAMQASDFESALKILTAARIDFPNSKEIAHALQSAQAGSARKAEENAAIARRQEIAEALERTLASESDPELQVRLAEEAVGRIPGNDAAERVLVRVRDRHRQIASAVDRARKFEQAQRFAESIQEWERVRQLWPQHPQLSAQTSRLNAALKAPPSTPEPAAAPPSPSPGFSATSIMAAAPAKAASPEPQDAYEALPATTPIEPQLVEDVVVARPAETAHAAEPAVETSPHRAQWFPRSKKLLLVLTSAAVIVVGAFILYRSLHTQPNPAAPKPTVVESHPAAVTPPTVTPPAVAPPPAMGKLAIRTNVDEVDILVDGVFKPGSGGRELAIPAVVGTHKIRVQKSGYASPPEQQVEIAKDRVSTLRFTLTKSTENANEPEPDTYLVIKSLPGSTVRIDGSKAGEVQPDGNFSLKSTPGPHEVELTQNGYQTSSRTVTVTAGNRRPIEMPLIAKPAPTIVSFVANASSIQEGESFELKWETQNAEVTIDGIGKVAPTYSTRVTPTTAGTIKYTLHAVGDGPPAEKTVSVSVAAIPKPVIRSFEAGARKIRLGDPVKLFWSTQNVTEVFITANPGPDVGIVEAESSTEVTPTKAGIVVYTLTVKGQGGTSDSRTAQVIVESASPPPPAPPPPPPPSFDKEVKDTIEIRYRDAYQSMSMDELHTVWPHIPPKLERATRELFADKSLKAIHLTFSNCAKPLITGDVAQYACTETVKYTMDKKVQPPQTLRVVFHLKKNDAGIWYVLDKSVAP